MRSQGTSRHEQSYAAIIDKCRDGTGRDVGRDEGRDGWRDEGRDVVRVGRDMGCDGPKNKEQTMTDEKRETPIEAVLLADQLLGIAIRCSPTPKAAMEALFAAASTIAAHERIDDEDYHAMSGRMLALANQAQFTVRSMGSDIN